MTSPSVSIIVPCHNGGRFLDGLLVSLSRQTWQDFEVVIVNNGSTEQATLDKLAELESKARIVHQENRYLPGARNRGFQEARAELVLPLDCDDRLEPSFLTETVATLRPAPPDVGFVFTHMRLTGSLEGVLESKLNRFDQLFLNHLPYCMLVRKRAWATVRGYDEAMRDGTEDWEFNIKLTKAGFRGIGIAKPLFIYNVRPDGMLLSKSARMYSTIWRHIRHKHPDLYRLPSLLNLWRVHGARPRSALRGLGLLSMRLLPESWFNALFFRMVMASRRRRIRKGELSMMPIES